MDELEQYVVIELNKESYAVKIEEISEVIKIQPITEVPNRLIT